MAQPVPSLGRPPLVGRADDLARLRALLARARGGKGGVAFLTGEGGVGKSRLVAALADEARRGGWRVAEGRAYPMESGVPYALVADALGPLLHELGSEKLSALTRGAEADLDVFFPARGLAAPARAAAPRGSEDANVRVSWTFAQFLKGFARREPLLIVLDDLHWADASTLELLHFTARHLGEDPVLLLGTLNEAEREAHPTLRGVEQSLLGLGAAVTHRLLPLTLQDTDALVRQTFAVGEAVSREFTALLHGWTRGNPFFIEETLKALVDSGRLRRVGDSWLGWEVESLELPGTIRDAVLLRMARLSPSAHEVAEWVAVVGTRTRYATLRAVCALPEAELVEALEELRRKNVLSEAPGDAGPVYDFPHPLIRNTVTGEIGLARLRLLHGAIAEALERGYGEAALQHADELAPHLVRGVLNQSTAKVVRYLAAAGRSALARFANREAADYLRAALNVVPEEAGASGGGAEGRFRLMEELARAKQRLGDYEEAIKLWRGVRDDAAARGDGPAVASMERRIGLSHFWAGRHAEALASLDAALVAAAGDERLLGRVRLARGVCLEFMGRGAEAGAEMERALLEAEASGDLRVRARVHRSLLLLHAWAGSPDTAREHGRKAISLAEEAGDPGVAGASHWGMAVLEGLTGHGEACVRHVLAGERLAEELRSPLLRLAFAEISVEYASGSGDWANGIALGERAITLARSLNQTTILPRLLVWTGLIYLGRGEMERARALMEEAWSLSGADDVKRARDVHSLVPAHTGLAAYHLATGNDDEAIRIGEAGLAIADRTGYTIWAIHRLLAIVGEAYLNKRDLESARRLGERLRRDAERMGHVLGVAWADACDAVLAWLQGDAARSAELLRVTADKLEAVPFLPDAARLRRHLAGRLRDLGDREGALRELRRVHDVFVQLGALEEVRRTRLQFRELDARPPVRPSGEGAAGLTGRELEIARLVADRKSNKNIAHQLGISPRTVTTHLSNIFQKLDIGSRAELAELSRGLTLEG